MEKISLKYIYPNIIKVLDEINLFRVIDNNLRESIVVYANNVDNQYHINMTNTNFGNIINICKLEKLLDVDKFMEKVIKYEKEIIYMNPRNIEVSYTKSANTILSNM